MRWLGASRVGIELAAFASTIVLARLIPPAAFGRFAVITALFLLAGALVADGVTAALVQRRTLTRAHVESGVLLAISVGLIGALSVLALSPLAEPVFGADTAALARLASPFFLIVALGAASRGMLQRGLSFRRLGAIEAAGVLSGQAASIGLALAGMEAEALILGALVGQALATVLLLLASPPPLPKRHSRELRQLLAFSLPNMGAGVASIGARTVDYAVLAARAPAATVGFYWRGYQLGVQLTRRAGEVLQQLALPLYSRAESADHRRFMRSRIVRLHTLLVVPVLALLILLAPLLVPAVFGERWEPAVLPTQLLAVIGMINTAQGGLGPMMVAVDRPRALMTWNVVNIASIGGAVYIAAPSGLEAVCLAMLGVRLVRYAAGYVFLLNRFAGVPIREMWLDPMPAAVASGIMIAAVGGLQALVLESLPPVAEIAAALALAPAVYLLALRVIFPDALTNLLQALARLLRREPGAEVIEEGLAEPAPSPADRA